MPMTNYFDFIYTFGQIENDLLLYIINSVRRRLWNMTPIIKKLMTSYDNVIMIMMVTNSINSDNLVNTNSSGAGDIQFAKFSY